VCVCAFKLVLFVLGVCLCPEKVLQSMWHTLRALLTLMVGSSSRVYTVSLMVIHCSCQCKLHACHILCILWVYGVYGCSFFAMVANFPMLLIFMWLWFLKIPL
jgi:hypothetical protein